MAPVSRVMVRVHCALARDTSNVVATLVISGAPRLPTAATTRAMNTSDGTSTRGSGRLDDGFTRRRLLIIDSTHPVEDLRVASSTGHRGGAPRTGRPGTYPPPTRQS